jgi:hypothetical protein
MERPLSEDNDIDAALDCIAMDLLWADPASPEHNDLMGKHGLPQGFAPNLDRGGDACVFGAEAVRTFSKAAACDYILRAHQPPDKGIRYQAGAKVITVFSSSHYCGMNNSAALIVVQSQQLDIGAFGVVETWELDFFSLPRTRNIFRCSVFPFQWLTTIAIPIVFHL